MRILIAIDGPASSGKGTVSAKVAEHFHIKHLDTGKIYRALGAKVREQGVMVFDTAAVVELAKTIGENDLHQNGLESEEIGLMASMVAAKPEVRQTLLEFQKQFAARPEGALLEGRDIGTVICPDAPFKFFLTAAVEERAKRRLKQLQENGDTTSTYESVLEALKARDERDSNRKDSPMKPADDATIIDATNLSREEAVKLIIQYVENEAKKISFLEKNKHNIVVL